jgi:hypothetical protein
MPPRPALHRVATALLALLYFVAWGEPVSLHPCPAHDGVAAAAAHAAPPAAPSAAHRGGQQGGHHDGYHGVAPAAPAAAAHPDGHDVPDGGHLCQCLGSGCCSAVVGAPTAQAVRWFVAVTRRAERAADGAHAAPRVAAPRLLPPATGPPAVG